jgi:hypothetical protein
MSLEDKLNKAGYCIICDEQIFEAQSLYPIGHPWQSRLRTAGGPMSNCRAVNIGLLDGSFTAVTACDKCVDKVETWDLEEIHEVLINSWKYEQSEEYRQLIGSRPLTQKQKERQERWLLKQVDNTLVEVIGVVDMINLYKVLAEFKGK